MKRMLTMLITALLALSLTACGGSNTGSGNTGTDSNGQDASQADAISDAAALLNTVWDSYEEEDKFPVVGGDSTEEHVNMEGPGVYSLEDAAALDTALGFPAASVEQIDGAASLVHMMNANTFTCGAYHVVDGGDVQALVTAIQENIQMREWICGFPEQLVIVTVEDYVVAFFGAADLTDTFLTHLTAAYPTAQVACEEPVA